MSDSRDNTSQQQEIPQAGGDQGGGGGDGDAAQVAEEQYQVAEEVDGGAGPRDHDQMEQLQGTPQGGEEQQQGVRWYNRKIARKAKILLLSPLRRIKRFYTRRCRSAYSYYGDDPGGCCCRCFRPPPPISPPHLRVTNPRNPRCGNPAPSSYEFVKFLIESNDFYAPHCNVHATVSTPST